MTTVATTILQKPGYIARVTKRSRVLGITGLVAFAIIWQLLSLAIGSTIFPTFTTSTVSAAKLLFTSEFTTIVLPSIIRALSGFVIASLIGAIVGVAVGRSKRIDQYLRSILDFMRTLPTPLLVPIFMIIFGLNGKMVVAAITSAAIWPVLLNCERAAANIDPVAIESATSLGYQGPTMARKVIIPSIAPSLFAGMRTALSLSLAVMVVAEILGGGSGLGYFISNSQQSFDIPGSYGGVMVLALLGLIFDTVFVAIEGKVLHWHHSMSKSEAN